jgi:diguanylate cyclase (GGDEF)-like protein/PAS domain S-box-containing protein
VIAGNMVAATESAHDDKAPAMSTGNAASSRAPIRDAALLAAIIESAPVAIVLSDRRGGIVLVNRETEAMFGYARDELMSRNIDVLVPQPSRAAHAQLRSGFFADPVARRMGTGRRLYGVRQDGAQVPIEIALTPITAGDELYVLSVIVDITQRRRLERRFEDAVESSPMAMVMVDDEGNIVLVNRETERLFGQARQQLLGKAVDLLLPECFRPDQAQQRAAFFHAPVASRMGGNRGFHGLRSDGGAFPVEVGLNPVATDEGMFSLIGIVDVTERKRLEADIRRANEELEQRVRDRTAELEQVNRDKELLLIDLQAQRAELDRLSREDALTGLANRRDFDQRIEAEIQRAQRQGTPLAVAMLDLDRFKDVNDRFGHQLGDAVLRQVGELIRHECRGIDIAGRYGGEEFALALPGSDLHAGIVLCERIRIAFERFDWRRLHEQLAAVTVSAGVSEWVPGMDASSLLADADSKLYQAKRLGRNRVVPEVSSEQRTV